MTDELPLCSAFIGAAIGLVAKTVQDIRNRVRATTYALGALVSPSRFSWVFMIGIFVLAVSLARTW